MNNQLHKRVLSALLAFAIFLSCCPVTTISAETTPDYSGDVGKYVQLVEGYAFSVADGSDISEAGAVPIYYDEFKEGSILRIAGWYWDEETTGLWYQVEVYTGGIVEESAEYWPADPWILYDYTDETYEFEPSFVFLDVCDVCGKPDCDTDHSATDPTVPEGPSVSGEVTDSQGNPVLGADGEPLVITVQGDLPEGAVVSASVPQVNGEVLPNVFDIKVYDADGNEWQPIDEGKTVTVSIPVVSDEPLKCVDVLHYIDCAEAQKNPGVEYISLDYITSDAQLSIQESINISNRAGYVPVEMFRKNEVVDNHVVLETNSFSIFALVNNQYVKQDVTTENGRLRVTFNIDYNWTGEQPPYKDVTQTVYASPDQLFYLDSSGSTSVVDPYSIVAKPSDATNEPETAQNVLNSPDTFLQNLEEPKDNAWDLIKYRKANLNIVDLVPGDVVWIMFEIDVELLFFHVTSYAYMKIVIVDEVDITFDKNLDSATLTSTTYGPLATDGDEDKNLFTIPTSADYIPVSSNAHYKFIGWDTSPAGDGERYTYNETTKTFTPGAFTPMRDMTLYAVWDADNYVINFDTNGGQETYESVTVAKNGTIKLPDAPTRADYIFIGWSATTDGYSKVYTAGSEFTVKQDATMYALWAVNLTITILGGDLTLWLEDEFSSAPLEDRVYSTSGNKMFEKSVSAEGVITYTATPIEGFFKNARFTFTYDTGTRKDPVYGSVGTSVAFSGSSGQLFVTLPATGMDANTTITISSAEKGSISYTVSYETNFGSPVAATVLQGLEGNTLQLNTLPTEVDTTRTGYALEGWYLDSSLTQKATVPMVITENITLYAKWNPITYTVTWDVDGVTTEETYQYGATIVKPKDPTKTGYTFTGWDPAVPATMPADDQTFTAQWKAQYAYALNFVANADGDTVTNIPVNQSVEWCDDASHTFTWTSEPTRQGYTFMGWSTDKTAAAGNKDMSYTVTGVAANTASVTLYAIWEPNTYTISATMDNGTISGMAASYEHGATAKVTFTPATGYKITHVTVNGVDQTLTEDGYVYENASMSEDVVIVVTTAAIEYSITYKDGDTTLTNTGNPAAYTIKDTVTLKDPADKTGYTFDGWYDPNGNQVTEIKNSTGNLTLTAQWTAHTYTIQYNGNGNTGGTMAKSNHTYDVEATLTANGFTKTGYTFTGWKDANGNVYTDGQLVTNLTAENGATVTLTAQWTAHTYTIQYNGNGNTGGTMAKSNHTYDVEATLTANGFTKTGYTFTGWKDANGNVYTDGQPVTNLTAENGATVTLTAQWTINQYTVTFVDWNGNVLDTQTVNHGTAATAPAAPTREGYTFSGWDKAFDNVTANLTVTTLYTINQYTVTFVDWNGNVLDTQTVNHGTAATAPTAPTREGYTFTDWDKDFSNVTSDLTVTAQYEVKSYTVTFKDWDGTVLDTQTVKPGDTVTMPAPGPWVDGQFSDWFHDLNRNGSQDDGELPYEAGDKFTMPAEDVTMVAVWKASYVRIGINMSYHIKGAQYKYWTLPLDSENAYHKFPEEPGSLQVEAIRAYMDSAGNWYLGNGTNDPEYMPTQGGVWNQKLPNDPSFYIMSGIFEDQNYVFGNQLNDYQGLRDPGVYGNIDTDGDLIKTYFKFDQNKDVNEAIYLDLIEAWLKFCRDTVKYQNTDIPWGSVLLQSDLENGKSPNDGLTREDFKVVPYVIKRDENGIWFVEMVILADEKHMLTYDTNMASGYSGAANLPEQWYGDQYQVTVADPGQITKTVDGVTYTAKFLHWVGSDGKIYQPGQTITMTNNLTLTAQWVYQEDLKITNTGESVDSNATFLYRIQGTDVLGKQVDMTVSIQGTGSVAIKGLYCGTYTVTELNNWSWWHNLSGEKSVEVTLAADDGHNLYEVTFENTAKTIWWLFAEEKKTN